MSAFSSAVRVSCLTLIGTTIVLGFSRGPSCGIGSRQPTTKPLFRLGESSPRSSRSHAAVAMRPTPIPAGPVVLTPTIIGSESESAECSTRAGFLRGLMSSAALACTAGVMVGGSAMSAAETVQSQYIVMNATGSMFLCSHDSIDAIYRYHRV